jgi:hypothetical protein
MQPILDSGCLIMDESVVENGHREILRLIHHPIAADPVPPERPVSSSKIQNLKLTIAAKPHLPAWLPNPDNFVNPANPV